jgi:hypothetical protein
MQKKETRRARARGQRSIPIWTRMVLVGWGIWAAPRVTWAQDAEHPLDADSDAMEPAAKDKASEPSSTEAAAPAPPDPEQTKILGTVGLGWVPASAYPAPVVRGIPGGSLINDMQGLQWPYLPAPGAFIGVSGYVWVDSSYRKVTAGSTNDNDTKEWLQQGRFVLRVTPTYNHENWFVQGQAEIVANNDQTQPRPREIVDTDDLYLRAGKWNVWDVQLGRFQGFDLYHLGLGLDLNTFERNGASTSNNTAVQLYGVTYLWDRPNGAGNVAVHAYPLPGLRLELLTQLGNQIGSNDLGIRGAFIYDLGFLKFRGGGEYQRLSDRTVGGKAGTKSRGVGGTVQFVFDPHIEGGFALARALVDQTDNTGGINPNQSTTTTSYGGFLNARLAPDLVVGGGVDYTDQTNLHVVVSTGKSDEFTHLQYFGAAQYKIADGFFVKAVIAAAKAKFLFAFEQGATPPFDNASLSGRLRVAYYF